MSVKASGQADASSGDISVTNNGSIATQGDDSFGIGTYTVAEAVSSASDASATSGDVTITSASIETQSTRAHGISANSWAFSKAAGSAAATAGDIEIISTGTVITHGEGSYGLEARLLAESAGESAIATGGNVAVTSGAVKATGPKSTGIVVYSSVNSATSGTGPAGSTGGDIVVTAGPIVMEGAESTGLYVFGGVSAISDNGDATATSGALKVKTGDVTVAGENGVGMFIETYADASGAGTASAQAGNVTIDSTGSISALNTNGIGIFARSLAFGSGAEAGDVAINILSGSVTGGSGFGYGVGIDNGNDNTITNHGTISALSGLAVRGAFGNETLDNSGIIVGNVDLGAGANRFNNKVGGTYQSGAYAYLGAGNTFTNDGDVTPGGTGAIQTSLLFGDFVQSAAGTYTVDVDWSTTNADVIDVMGSAELAGTVVAAPINFLSGGGLTRQFLILQAAGGAVDNGISVADTAAVDYDVVFDANGQDVYLKVAIDFRGNGALNANQTAIAENINAIQTAGNSPGFIPVATALTMLPTQAALVDALDQLSPELFSYANIETLFAAEQFSQDLLSCSVADGSGAAFIRQGQCIWARGRARFLDLDATADNVGADSTVGSFSGGVQLALATDWRLALAAGYDSISLDAGPRASADGDRAHLGVAVKYNPGPLLLAAAASGGWSAFDTRRTIAFGGFNDTATGDSDVNYASGRLHAAVLLDQGSWYLKPLVDGTVTYIDADGVAERGGSAALTVGGTSDTIYAVSPALEIGGEMRFSELSVLRPFLRAGVTWRAGDSLDLAASFATAPAGVGPFTIATALDDVLADVSAGVDLINAGGAVLRVQYDGRFGEDTAQNSASLKGSVPF
ncbi:autotransporter outer membrane beta-barrel domain-containing protein [Hyphomicrobium sp. CS1GBMeth3]|uniref:autotransporter outer membrane beta-barrel domain-containing protein n=1 Tax=Hyphomicrobium sp. CS1GBMeth3 TaxID=1892845 RepID=UPI0015C53E18|nr:autotransporter outer membrane beta-barrel domain-containing protein [Hyphomicrobium sp. CS1GBMeth3]